MTYVEIAELVFNSKNYHIWINECEGDQFDTLNGGWTDDEGTTSSPVNCHTDITDVVTNILLIAAMEGEL